MSLSTSPSLEGAALCPEGVVSLVCTADDLATDAIRWFLCSEGLNCSIDDVYAVKASISGDAPFDVPTPIPGITVTVDSESRHSGNLFNYNSTLIVNLTVFDAGDGPVPLFRCGSFRTMSNAISLNLRIRESL